MDSPAPALVILKYNQPDCMRNGLIAGRVAEMYCIVDCRGGRKYFLQGDHGRIVRINLRDIEGVASVG